MYYNVNNNMIYVVLGENKQYIQIFRNLTESGTQTKVYKATCYACVVKCENSSLENNQSDAVT